MKLDIMSARSACDRPTSMIQLMLYCNRPAQLCPTRRALRPHRRRTLLAPTHCPKGNPSPLSVVAHFLSADRSWPGRPAAQGRGAPTDSAL